MSTEHRYHHSIYELHGRFCRGQERGHETIRRGSFADGMARSPHDHRGRFSTGQENDPHTDQNTYEGCFADGVAS